MLKNNSIMLDIINDIEKYPELRKAFNSINDYQKIKFINAISGMKHDAFKETDEMHGVCHGEKVALFSYLLGIKLGCNDRVLDILLIASMYHDFKKDPCRPEDCLHGHAAAWSIDEVINIRDFSERELKFMKCMMEYHCVDKSSFGPVTFEWEISLEDNDACLALCNILKDADALDRKRFSDDSVASLDTRYLNYKESLSLIPLSEEINKAYIDRTITDYSILNNEHLHSENSSCFHSIGKNLFRLNSVLDNGLLSHSELNKSCKGFTRNFDGSNSEEWISVVPSNKVSLNAGAKQEFLDHGIVFIIDNCKLYYTDKGLEPNYARWNGLPYKLNGGYSDERFAFKGIPKEKIVGIFVNKELGDTDLRNLDHYVYDSFCYSLFLDNVKFYLNKMGLLSCSNITKEFERDMNEYKKIDEEYSKKRKHLENDEIQVYGDKLQTISKRINKRIGKYMHEYYANLLNKSPLSKISFRDAIVYEIKQSNYDYQVIDGEETLFVLSPKIKDKDKVLEKIDTTK